MTRPPAPVAYKILPAADWAAALAAGAYHGSTVDRADGFIHLSAPDQVRATAAKWFAGQTDLVLVAIDLSALGDAVRWEPSRGGALFPHVYGPIPAAAADRIWPLALGPDGVPDIPVEAA